MLRQHEKGRTTLIYDERKCPFAEGGEQILRNFSGALFRMRCGFSQRTGEMHLWPARFFVKSKRQDDLSSRLKSRGDEALDSNAKSL